MTAFNNIGVTTAEEIAMQPMAALAQGSYMCGVLEDGSELFIPDNGAYAITVPKANVFRDKAQIAALWERYHRACETRGATFETLQGPDT